MAGRLADKVVIVAGAGGIGDGLVRRYAAEGAKLVIGDLRGDHAAALAAEVDPSGARAVGTELDGAEDASIAAMVALALARFGRLDGIHVNYAHVTDAHFQGGVELPLDLLDEGLRTNLRGYFLCARHAIPAMVKTGGGAIVFTSSVEAYKGTDVRFAYAMAKAGMLGLMRNIAVRYGVDGIRANAICPGYIGHERMSGMPDEVIDMVRSRTAIKSRVGRPDDIAAMGAFLLSDDAGYISGQTIAVDGGGTMRP
ncbi:SDR family NAD(P)-dependent oxidoreductase [Novosphingobium bradum]|uniref:SDR family NAD(P)-dependent oxidoreductase n=1 Tax=Novosphingobium bradum TaxID=1737444 RepID=A0ABV7IMD8_9SPHN